MRFTIGIPRASLRSVRVHVSILIAFGVLAAAGQFVANALSLSDSLQTQLVDGLEIAASAYAILCCLDAARRLSGVSRAFWLLFGGGIGLQLCADVGWTYVHFAGISVSAADIFPSLFYRLYAGPMAIALFLSGESNGSKFRSFLDGCIVVGLVGLTMYQVQIAEMSTNNPRFWQSITLTTAVNALLASIAVVRYLLCTPGCLRGLFLRQVIYLWTYVGVCTVTSVTDAYFPAWSSYADLLWSVSYVAAAVLAVTWRPPAVSLPQKPRISRRTALLCFNLTLASMVLASTIVGLRLVDPTRIVGLVGIAIVLFSFAVRSALMQDAQEKTLVDLQESRAELRRQALFDSLTGLPNRRLLSDRLDQALASAKRDGCTVALLYLDLDGFKPVNDRFGHAAGDRVLAEVAQRMRSSVRESDTVARMGGDEFTLLLNHVTERSHAETVAAQVLRTLNEPMEVEGKTIAITASIGVAFFPRDAADCDSLIECADHAMYAAKRHGTECIQCYVAGLGSAIHASAQHNLLRGSSRIPSPESSIPV